MMTGKMHFVGPDQLHGLHKRLTTDIYPADLSWMPKFIDEANHVMQYPGNAVIPMTHLIPPAKYWDMYKDADMDIPLINQETAARYTTLDKWLNNGFHRNDNTGITDHRIINDAMQLSGVNWDYTPVFPGSQRYVR